MRLRLLTVNNTKTAKGTKQGYLTGVLHLAPYKLSGYNVCPMADIAGCWKGCLNTAGRGGIGKGALVTYDSIESGTLTNRVQQARIRRTRLFMENRNEFMRQLVADIQKLWWVAKKQGLKPAVRLNGTSDIRWEDIEVRIEDPKGTGFDTWSSVFTRFPHIQFYDYTKLPNRGRALDIPNYHLTFSYSHKPEYLPYVEKAIKAYGDKVNIAVVHHGFGNLSPASSLHWRHGLPSPLNHRRIVNGDAHDLRFLDPKGCVVALKAKGNAKKDASGFVVKA